MALIWDYVKPMYCVFQFFSPVLNAFAVSQSCNIYPVTYSFSTENRNETLRINHRHLKITVLLSKFSIPNCCPKTLKSIKQKWNEFFQHTCNYCICRSYCWNNSFNHSCKKTKHTALGFPRHSIEGLLLDKVISKGASKGTFKCPGISVTNRYNAMLLQYLGTSLF